MPSDPLAGTQLTLTDTATTTISGPGANLLSISGGGMSRVFGISFGASAARSGLMIAGGNADHGGGLLNEGTATLTNCTVRGNGLSDEFNICYSGAGVFNSGTATLTLTNRTVSDNHILTPIASVSASGGGLFNEGTTTLTNCTVSGNSATGNGADGGWLLNVSEVTLTNCTVSGNSAPTGGGLHNVGGARLDVGNTIVAGNTAASGIGPDVLGAVTSLGHNLIGAGGLTAGVNGDVVGVAVADVLVTDSHGKPLLADNGGPTRTIALKSGSPAITSSSSAGAASPVTVATSVTSWVRKPGTAIRRQRARTRNSAGAAPAGAVRVQAERPVAVTPRQPGQYPGRGARRGRGRRRRRRTCKRRRPARGRPRGSGRGPRGRRARRRSGGRGGRRGPGSLRG